ncbi:MAG: hypothetical protein ACK56I_00340, partial [bacterium]
GDRGQHRPGATEVLETHPMQAHRSQGDAQRDQQQHIREARALEQGEQQVPQEDHQADAEDGGVHGDDGRRVAPAGVGCAGCRGERRERHAAGGR